MIQILINFRLLKKKYPCFYHPVSQLKSIRTNYSCKCHCLQHNSGILVYCKLLSIRFIRIMRKYLKTQMSVNSFINTEIKKIYLEKNLEAFLLNQNHVKELKNATIDRLTAILSGTRTTTCEYMLKDMVTCNQVHLHHSQVYRNC